jgi:thiosulfate dehydrogenase
MLRILLGVVIGVVLVPLAVMGWFKFGHPPVAVADKPLPFERNIVAVPMHARIDSQLVKTPPIQPDEATLVAGAQIYDDNCSACHGYRGKPVSFAANMYPHAPALWEKHRTGNVVGVSDDPPGETYWKVANGIRLSGMPAFSKTLSDTQMWQVTLLLANADKPLPPAALEFLTTQPPTETASGAPAKRK